MDYSKYPFFLAPLRKIGLTTPWMQYTLYGTIIGAYVVIRSLRKPYYVDKWMNETNDDLKKIWQYKGKMEDLELKVSKFYFKQLRQTPRQYALVPISFCVFEAAKEGYKYVFK